MVSEMPGGDDVRIRDYMDTRINELARTIDYRMHALESSVAERFAGMVRAVDKAELSMNARLEGMNEFREQLKEQTASFTTRKELETSTAAIFVRMEDFRTQMEGLLREQGKRIDEVRESHSTQLAEMRSINDRREGGQLKMAAMISLIPIIIAVLALWNTFRNSGVLDAIHP